MDLGHWNLAHDPFAERHASYVATPVHAEAVARIVHAVTSGDRRVTLAAAPGLGKTVVLGEVLERLRDPRRRIARTSGVADGTAMVADLARRLGVGVPANASRAGAWKALGDAARLCRIQGQAVVLAVDDAHWLESSADGDDLARLDALDGHPARRVSVIRVGRDPDDGNAGLEPEPWELVVRLTPLSRTEAAGYLRDKLACAGRTEPVFTPRAVTRLHGLARGVPRGLDRLASLALTAGAYRGLEIIGPEILDGVAEECVTESIVP